MFTGFIFLLQK